MERTQAGQAAASGQQAVRHVSGKLAADAAPGADPGPLMFGLKLRPVVDITEAQRAGVGAVIRGFVPRFPFFPVLLKNL